MQCVCIFLLIDLIKLSQVKLSNYEFKYATKLVKRIVQNNGHDNPTNKVNRKCNSLI